MMGRLCFDTCPSDMARGVPLLGGYPTSGTPSLTWLGVSLPGGTPPWVPPPIRPGWGVTPAGEVPLPGGYPTLGTPIRPGWGIPARRVPHLRYPPPPLDLARGVHLPGGTPPQVIDGVLHTPQSVCLLRSRRRTF